MKIDFLNTNTAFEIVYADNAHVLENSEPTPGKCPNVPS
jgi:hypothetical protein